MTGTLEPATDEADRARGPIAEPIIATPHQPPLRRAPVHAAELADAPSLWRRMRSVALLGLLSAALGVGAALAVGAIAVALFTLLRESVG